MCLFFLFDFSTNISNKSFIIKYDLRYDFWCFNNDVWDEFDDNVINMSMNLKKRDLNTINAIDVICLIDVIDAIKFIDIIEKLIENVSWQIVCVFAIKINKCDNDVNVVIDFNIIDKKNNLNEKKNVIDKLI